MTNDEFRVIVVGYNHKMRILLDTIVGKIAQFEVKEDRVAVIKETVMKEYQNFKFQQPYQQAMYYCSLILEDHSWPWFEALEILPYLEAGDLAKFSPVMLSKAFLECYVAGNIDSNEAESLVQHIEDVFYKGPKPICRPLFPSEHLTKRIIKLERGVSHFYSVEGLNPSDENSALVHYIQVHQDDLFLNVKLQLFALVAKQPAFHQLRSVEQLGYITVLRQRNDSGIRDVQFIVQSTEKSPSMALKLSPPPPASSMTWAPHLSLVIHSGEEEGIVAKRFIQSPLISKNPLPNGNHEFRQTMPSRPPQ